MHRYIYIIYQDTYNVQNSTMVNIFTGIILLSIVWLLIFKFWHLMATNKFKMYNNNNNNKNTYYYYLYQIIIIMFKTIIIIIITI